MNYRFQKITTIYPEFQRQFLSDNPDYPSLSYDELFQRFAKTLYAWSDFFTTHMGELGNEAQDLFASLEPLQKIWATENGANYREESWLHDIALAQVRTFQPDVLFLQDLYQFDRSFREKLRSVCKTPVLLVGWRAAPTTDFDEFTDLDLILTAFPHFVERLQASGANAHLMLHAFEHTILQTVPCSNNPDRSFTFAGSLGGRDGSFSGRYALVEQLMAATPLEVWGKHANHPIHGPKDWMLHKSIYTSNRLLSSFGIDEKQRGSIPLVRNGVRWVSDPTTPPLNSRYPERFHAAVFGTEYFELLSRSKTTLNFHINAAEQAASNIRLYEATGMGACLITDWKPNLRDIFEPDTEIVTYRSIEECVDKVNYLLLHENAWRSIADAGQRRTLKDHRLAQRVEQLDEWIRAHFRDSASHKARQVPRVQESVTTDWPE